MKPQPLQADSKSLGLSNWHIGRWLATSLGVAALAAIGYVAYVAAWPAAGSAANNVSNPAVQIVPEAGLQGVNGYIAAHDPSQVNTAPDAALRAAREAAWVKSHAQAAYYAADRPDKNDDPAYRSPLPVQSVPDAAFQGVYGYVLAHDAGQPQATYYAADRPNTHGDPPYHSPLPVQSVPDAASQGVIDYLLAHDAREARAAFDPANQPSTHDDPAYHSPRPVQAWPDKWSLSGGPMHP